MHVLFVTQGHPADARTGGLIAAFYRILELARAGHEVTVVALTPRGGADEPQDGLTGIAEVVTVRDVPPASGPRLLSNLADPLPWPIRRYASRRLAAAIRRCLSERPFDLVVLNSLHSASMLDAARSEAAAPCLLLAHNVQSTIMELYWRHQAGPAARAYAWIQWRKMLSYERGHAGRFDLVAAFTAADRAELARLAPGADIRVAPLTVDVGRLAAAAYPEEHDVLFLAYLGWAPNQDSLRWFLQEIHPAIERRRPGTRVEIAGADAPGWLREAARARPWVRFHGAVDDVLPYYAGARVVVVPLRIGSGVRVKIIQAMAMRRAIVSTSKGCEGLDVEDGRHLVVADDPDAFAAATARLLDAPAERARLGEEAHRLASARHDAMADHPPFVALCEELAAGCTGRRT